MIKITISENQADQRLDRFLKKYLEKAPLSFIYKLIRKDVKVNGRRSTAEAMLKAGDEVTLYITEGEASELMRSRRTVKAKRMFSIAYEDENMLIAEKPFGLLTHGDRNEKKNHLANQVIDYLIETGAYEPRTETTFTPAPVNRLDRNTTGLVLFGKNARSLKELSFLIRETSCVTKTYRTIVYGHMTETLHLSDFMKKDERLNIVSVIRSGAGPQAADGLPTGVKTMETIAVPICSCQSDGKWFTLIEVRIITGRTHQIRAHLKDAGYPLIGDPKYGSRAANEYIFKRFALSTQLLHAYKLEFSGIPQDSCLAYMNGRAAVSALPDGFMRIQQALFKA